MKQAPVASLAVLGHSVEQDLESGNQATDMNALEGVMDILVDISSCLLATERGVEDLTADSATTKTQRHATSWQGSHTA